MLFFGGQQSRPALALLCAWAARILVFDFNEKLQPGEMPEVAVPPDLISFNAATWSSVRAEICRDLLISVSLLGGGGHRSSSTAGHQRM